MEEDSDNIDLVNIQMFLTIITGSNALTLTKLSAAYCHLLQCDVISVLR